MLVFKQTKKKRVDPPQRDVFNPVLKQSKERPQDLQTQIDLQIAIFSSGSNFKTSGLVRVRPGRLGHGESTGFCRVVVPAGLLTNPNRSSYRIPGQHAGPVRV